MRLDRLDLIRWGALADVTLDLSGGSHGVHVIYGDNEAGKSTTRRAISALLFGIPAQSSDRFRFDYKALRLGGVLRMLDGTTFAFQRKKGTKDTVVDVAGAPISDGPLRHVLGEIGRDGFEHEWSLDHERLRAGGEALLRGEGEVGQSLLGAGLGGVGVGAIVATLESEAKEVFSRRGGSRVARLLEQISERRRLREAHAVNTKEVREQREELARLRAARDTLGSERRARVVELSRLERALRALPVLVERDRIEQELARFEGLASVGPDFGKRCAAAQASFEKATLARERAERDLRQCEERMGRIVVDGSLLVEGERVDALYAELAAHVEREKQIGVWQTELELLNQSIDAAATAAAAPRDSLVALATHGVRALYERARELADRATEVRAQVSALEARVRADASEMAKLEDARRAVPPSEDDAALRKAFERARTELGPATKSLAALEARYERSAAAARKAFDALPHWTRGPLGRRALVTAQLPPVAQIDACARRLALSADADGARLAETRATDELRALNDAVEALTVTEISTATSVERARAERDRGWALVRATLAGTPPTPSDVERFSRGEPLAVAYERAVATADNLADHMFEGGARAAKLAQAIDAQKLAEERLATARETAAQLATSADAAREEWRALWRPLGIDPGSPEAMRAWLVTAEEVRTAVALEAEAALALATLRERVDVELSGLALLLGPSEAQSREVDAVFAIVATRLSANEERRRRRAELESAHERAAARHLEATTRLAAELARDAAWAEDWAAFAKEVGVDAARSPREVIALLGSASDVASHLQRTDVVSRDLAAAKMQCDAYVSSAARMHVGGDVEAGVRLLQGQLMGARLAAQELSAERARTTEAAARRDLESTHVATARAALDALAVEAGTEDHDELARVEAASEERRELLGRRAKADAELTMVAVDGLASLRAEVKALSLVDIPSAERTLLDARDATDERINTTSQAIGELENELRRVTGGADAAEDESEIQGLIASVGEASHDLLRLSLASSLLRQAAERYRQENQSPILRRTSELFARVTVGSFSGVVVDEDDAPRSTKNVIKGMRAADGTAVPVEGMSDGVRDQLFLSLRLAALEHHQTEREPLPFVLDDILINLSDARAEATLDVLADVAKGVQVLLFTHHSRVVELATGLSRAGRDVFVHELRTPAT